MNRLFSCCFAAAYFLCGGISWADTFGTGTNSFDIDFVTIRNPGNPPDAPPNPAGAVSYEYRIGKYEISEQMIDRANALGGLGITKDTRGPEFPATDVTWYEAARFVNWLNTSTGNHEAYKFSGADFQLWQPTDAGYDSTNLFRNKQAKYFLPSINEWHKAAYYEPNTGVYFDYPTGTDSVPDGIDFAGDPNFDAVFFDGGSNGTSNNATNVGISSPYGTFGQGGNVREWVETAFDRVNNSATEQRSTPGGSWADSPNLLAAWNTGIGVSAQDVNGIVGFRISSIVPEPGGMGLLVFGLMRLLALRRRAK